jgi:catalase
LSSPLVDQAVAAMEKYTGTKPGYRRAHPRGLVCSATFVATPALGALSSAEHFQGDAIPAQVRLSNAAGSPLAPDRASPTVGKVLGLAVRFRLPSGAVASWAAANLPSFVARTPEDFVRITSAQKPALFGKPNPLKILAYLWSRPSAFAAVKAIAMMPVATSFAHVRFNGIHTYGLVAPDGARQPFRYAWVPRAAVEPPHVPPGSEPPAQYLLAELRARLAKEPLSWELRLQLPAAGDPLDDATRAWPEDRRTLVGGTLTVDAVAADQRALETLVFDPTGVVPGLELSADPLLRFRADVYSESYRRRASETRDGAAPADMGQ